MIFRALLALRASTIECPVGNDGGGDVDRMLSLEPQTFGRQYNSTNSYVVINKITRSFDDYIIVRAITDYGACRLLETQP